MNKSHIPQGIAAFAAIVMTLVIVNSVVSLADEDKAALATAQSGKNAALVSSTGSVSR